MNVIRLTVVFAFFYLLNGLNPGLFAQTEAESAGVLKIQQIDNSGKVHIFPVGKLVTIYTLDGEKVKGALTNVSDDALEVEGRKVEFSKIDWLRVKNPGRQASKWSGLVIMSVGGLAFILGLIFGITAQVRANNSTSGDCGEALGLLILMVMGIVLGLAGFIVICIGLIPFLIGVFAGKKYKMSKWKLSRNAD